MSEQTDRTSGTLRRVDTPPAENNAALSGARPDAGKLLTLRAVVVSDLGRARDHQEDTAAFFAPADAAILAQRGYLLAVADGMGGHNAGEVASQMAIGELERVYYLGNGDDLATGLSQAIQAANQAVYKLAQADVRRQGMGTTVAAAVVHDRDLWVANVGDSRVYLVRGGQITQITRDHSWVEEQVRAGVLTPEQARIHPQRNIITRAIGTGAAVEADYFTSTLQENDILVLCSDGLTGHLAEQEILEIVTQSPPDRAAHRLIDLANERGGLDNITVIVARVEPAGTPALAPAAAPLPPARRSPVLWMALLAGVILGLLIVVYLILRQTPASTTTATPAGGVVAGLVGSPPSIITAGAAVSPTLGASAGISTGQPLTLTLVVPGGIISPTATLRPTVTPTPTTATPTPRQETATTATTGTATPAVTASGLVPELTAPVDGADIAGDEEATFVWDGPDTLSPNQAFEVRIWKEGQPTHLGAAEPVPSAQGGRWQQTIRVGDTPAVQQGGDGTYWWSVALVRRSDGARIGREASPRRFVYRTASAGPPPTNTPRPPTDTPQPPTDTPKPR